MRDEELRSSLADVVTSAVQRGVPDVSVLRRRIRRRTVRRLVSGAVVVAVIAGIGIGVNASLPSGKAPLPRPVVASGGHHRAPAATWFPAEKLPAADAAPSVAPYVVDISELAQPVSVMSAATGKQAAVINPPAGVTYVGVAAAGDGYTFVLAGTAGSEVRFYEVRLGASGAPGAPVLVLSVPASSILDPASGPDTFFSYAISPDASMLAYATLSSLTVVSLATGKTVSWPLGKGGLGQLSWAGDDRTLALDWAAGSSTAAARAQEGVRVLNVSASGTLLQASRLVVPASATGPYGGYPLMTADGSKVFVSYYADMSKYGPSAGAVREYSVRSGQLIATATPTTHVSPTAAELLFCQALWTDPAGTQAVSFCNQVGANGVYLFDGHVRAEASPQVPMNAGIDGISFNTTNQILGPWYAW
jgi:hypothetical protein